MKQISKVWEGREVGTESARVFEKHGSGSLRFALRHSLEMTAVEESGQEGEASGV